MQSIEKIKQIVNPIARDYQVEKVYIFGSYARGNATPKSDVDFRIDKGNLRGLFKFASFLSELETALDMSIDMVTTNSLSEEFLNKIREEGEVLIYENMQ